MKKVLDSKTDFIREEVNEKNLQRKYKAVNYNEHGCGRSVEASDRSANIPIRRVTSVQHHFLLYYNV